MINEAMLEQNNMIGKINKLLEIENERIVICKFKRKHAFSAAKRVLTNAKNCIIKDKQSLTHLRIKILCLEI